MRLLLFVCLVLLGVGECLRSPTIHSGKKIKVDSQLKLFRTFKSDATNMEALKKQKVEELTKNPKTIVPKTFKQEVSEYCPQCYGDRDCNDFDACTHDTCYDGYCHHEKDDYCKYCYSDYDCMPMPPQPCSKNYCSFEGSLYGRCVSKHVYDPDCGDVAWKNRRSFYDDGNFYSQVFPDPRYHNGIWAISSGLVDANIPTVRDNREFCNNRYGREGVSECLEILSAFGFPAFAEIGGNTPRFTDSDLQAYDPPTGFHLLGDILRWVDSYRSTELALLLPTESGILKKQTYTVSDGNIIMAADVNKDGLLAIASRHRCDSRADCLAHGGNFKIVDTKNNEEVYEDDFASQCPWPTSVKFNDAGNKVVISCRGPASHQFRDSREGGTCYSISTESNCNSNSDCSWDPNAEECTEKGSVGRVITVDASSVNPSPWSNPCVSVVDFASLDADLDTRCLGSQDKLIDKLHYEFDFFSGIEPGQIGGILPNEDGYERIYVNLPLNNGFAILKMGNGLEMSSLVGIHCYGYKNMLLDGNALDTAVEDKGILLRNYPIYALFQPQGFKVVKPAYRGDEAPEAIIYTANTGAHIGGEMMALKDATLEESRFDIPSLGLNANKFKDPKEAGDLRIFSNMGMVANKYEKVFISGARSFSVWSITGPENEHEVSSLNLMFDSGNQFEMQTARYNSDVFNSKKPVFKDVGLPTTPRLYDLYESPAATWFDTASLTNGPAPTDVALGRIFGFNAAVVTLANSHAIAVYDVSIPAYPKFKGLLDYSAQHNSDGIPSGDIHPSGVTILEYPSPCPRIAVAYGAGAGAGSGNVVVYDLIVKGLSCYDHGADWHYAYYGNETDRPQN